MYKKRNVIMERMKVEKTWRAMSWSQEHMRSSAFNISLGEAEQLNKAWTDPVTEGQNSPHFIDASCRPGWTTFYPYRYLPLRALAPSKHKEMNFYPRNSFFPLQ